MTPEQFAQAMYELATNDDGPEDQHRDADRLMTALLVKLGYEDGVKIFWQIKKWYA